MRPIRIGLVAAMAIAALAPASAMSQIKNAKASAAQAKAAAQAQAKGMAEAPPLVQSAGVRCSMTEARWMGEDKTQGANIYEVACQEGLGYVLIHKASDPATGQPATQAFNCLETSRPAADGTPNSLTCTLPGNADPKAGLAPFVAKSGTACVMDKARAIGTGSKNAYFEVACQDGAGYIMVTSNPLDPNQPVQMNTCLAYEPGGNLNCQLTDRATQLKVVDALVAKSGKTCQISDRRYVLSTKNGDNYYEVSCVAGTGYMVQENAKGELARILDCGSADFVGGGCTMTDARAAKTEQSALYSKLATKAGFDCDVSKYAPLPTQGAQEVIEMQCSNRPDGGIGIFTAQGGKVLDCVHAELDGYRCSFTEKKAVFSKLTANLKTLGKNSCTVSDARAVGKTADEGFIEVACSDGLPGWVIGYPTGSEKPKEVLSCAQAGNIGSGGCKLAGNRR